MDREGLVLRSREAHIAVRNAKHTHMKPKNLVTGTFRWHPAMRREVRQLARQEGQRITQMIRTLLADGLNARRQSADDKPVRG